MVWGKLLLCTLATATAPCEECSDSDASLLQFDPAPAVTVPEALPQLGAQTSLPGYPVRPCDWSVVSAAIRTFYTSIYEACQLVDLYSSTSETFTQKMAVANDFSDLGFGVTSYFPTLSPNFSAPTTYLPYSRDEYSFLINWQAKLDIRIASFAVSAMLVYRITPTALAHAAYTKVAKAVDPVSIRETSSFIQGGGTGWQSDAFAGQLVGRTLMACFLEKSSSGFTLDLSEHGAAATPVQRMKQKALSVAPENLLRAKGHFEEEAKGLRLVSVEVEDGEGGWLALKPSDGTRWTLAKVTLLSLALFVLECYHTGIHLYAGVLSSAVKASVPAGTSLGRSISPNTLQTIFALFEQAAILHSDHNSAFSGTVWPCNITEVWQVTRDMARYYVSASPEEILGLPEEAPDWWAGNSASFIEPIASFANATAAAAMEDQDALLSLQSNLENFGLMDALAPNVTTQEGLARLVRNMLFVAGICHSHMYSTREAFTPLLGFTETQPFLKYLRGSLVGLLGFDAVVTVIWPTVPSQMNQLLILIYATGSGFGKGVPELGDGPYYVDDAMDKVVERFQAQLNNSRKVTYEMFGDVGNNSFVPGYLYPVEVKKPFGYGITQTAYI